MKTPITTSIESRGSIPHGNIYAEKDGITYREMFGPRTSYWNGVGSDEELSSTETVLFSRDNENTPYLNATPAIWAAMQKALDEWLAAR